MGRESLRQWNECEMAAEVQAALAQLAAASENARNIMAKAQAFLGDICPTDPMVLRLSESEAAVPMPAGDVPAGVAASQPRWDRKSRVLRVGSRVVKRYRLPSPNQERILAAFEEEGWPASIDDPLPPVSGLCAKQRLHDTIKSLNARQEQRLLFFRGDGTGQRVCCELIASNSAVPFVGSPRLRRAA